MNISQTISVVTYSLELPLGLGFHFSFAGQRGHLNRKLRFRILIQIICGLQTYAYNLKLNRNAL